MLVNEPESARRPPRVRSLDVVRGDRHALGVLCDAGVARRTVKLVAEGRGGNGPAERVLAPAAADNQYLHATPNFLPQIRFCAMVCPAALL